MLKTTVGKIVAGVLATMVVCGVIVGGYLYHAAMPWLGAKERMEELKDGTYSFTAQVTMSEGILPSCEISGEKEGLCIHGDLSANGAVLTDIYAGVGKTTYINTRQVTERFLASMKTSLEQVPLVGSVVYGFLEQALPSGDRYMTLQQVEGVLSYIDVEQFTGGTTATAFREYTYRGTENTPWGTYEVTKVEQIDSLPEDYNVDSNFFLVTFSNGNRVELSVPKDASEKSDYLVVHTDQLEAQVMLHYDPTTEVKAIAYPTESDYSDEDMEALQEIFETIQELQNY